MKKISESITMAAVPVLARGVIRFLAVTMRTTYVNFEGYRAMAERGENVIIAFWHGRLLMMPYTHFGKKGITTLVSQSSDGELVSRTVKGLGIGSVRGSSTRGRLSGIKGLLKSAREGKDIAIAPDGPRGPGMKAQMGVIQVARATGLPIMPMTFGASKKKPSEAGIPSSCRTLSQGAYLSAPGPSM